METIKKINIIYIILLLMIMGCTRIPKGTSVRGTPYYTRNVDFLMDETYVKDGERHVKQQILDYALDIMDSAEEFIVVDMFLYNSIYDSDSDFPAVTKAVTEKLIEKKNEGLEIYLITDEINTFYKVYDIWEFKALKEAGIKIIETDMTKVRDSNITYSILWRTVFKWFGTGGIGWVKNPFSEDAPRVTVRGYLKLLNLKANHRKVVVSEKKALVASMNFHDASGYHSNIGFGVEGPVVKEILNSEIDVASFSGENISLKIRESEEEEGEIRVTLLTEKMIGENIEDLINTTEPGNEIKIGMFYLGDRRVIGELIKAGKRGVKIKIILDGNIEAFGRNKNGIPNRVVAWELKRKGGGNIEVRWYNTSGEQFHSKFIIVNKEDEVILIGGSANFTKRNIQGYNLETDLMLEAPIENKLSLKANSYFNNMWGNIGGNYTLSYEEKAEESYVKYFLYRFQEFSGWSTF
ncbi:phospholipase D-like domain-containing protein [uncultured Ilyobacter sp.]|uniref:phospholipase D-like domain-containing protein n=1 Tax=uncultured Ilyobacter sp. TaxID=544433 RepID=UPI002AA7A550|nr:phospholipase D-like domain-containing protein [uncultured Ilyobacter sp.]